MFVWYTAASPRTDTREGVQKYEADWFLSYQQFCERFFGIKDQLLFFSERKDWLLQKTQKERMP